jgi:hypothetical protein
MRRFSLIISTIFILSAFYCVGQTDTYHSFPDNVFWRVDAYAWDTFTGCEEDYYYHYYVDGDTAINGNIYKKIIRGPVLINTQGGGAPCYVWPWATFTGYRGALRDDPESNKVYFVLPDDETENLLFDYDIAVGEIIQGILTANCTMTISTIDSVLVGADYRKRWNFTTCNEGEGYFIQGIGSDNGLIEWFNSIGFAVTGLVCVKDDGQVLFESDWNSAVGCELITSIDDKRSTESNAYFYPNPFSGHTTFWVSKALQNATLNLTNSIGQVMKQVQNINGKQVTISRDGLAPGIYYFTLAESNRLISTGKLILIE